MQESNSNVFCQYSIGVLSRTFQVARSLKHTTLGESMILPSRAPSIKKMADRSHHHKHEPYDYVSGSDSIELLPLPKLSADFNLDAEAPRLQNNLVLKMEDQKEALTENQKLELCAREIQSFERQQDAMDFSIQSELFSKIFISLVVICTIRATTTCYFFSNFKIMGM